MKKMIEEYMYKNFEGKYERLDIASMYLLIDRMININMMEKKRSLKNFLWVQKMIFLITKSKKIKREKSITIEPVIVDGRDGSSIKYKEVSFSIKIEKVMKKEEYEDMLKSRILTLKNKYDINFSLEEMKILMPNNTQKEEEFELSLDRYKNYLDSLIGKLYKNAVMQFGITTTYEKAFVYAEFDVF